CLQRSLCKIQVISDNLSLSFSFSTICVKSLFLFYLAGSRCLGLFDLKDLFGIGRLYCHCFGRLLKVYSGKRESRSPKTYVKRSHLSDQNLVIKTFLLCAAATTRHTSWIVATAIAAVEARWNYPLRFFNKDVKARLRAIAVTSRPPSSASSSSSSSADLVKDNHPMPKSEASMERVMGLSCFGPTTVRF
ncbi:hypothetical protein ARALYDRAFT_480330, partial [Arabidopsis lyrata subsp. lyrata]